jgi:peptidoglycan pentaglycine glycine transferase (the first glycine)
MAKLNSDEWDAFISQFKDPHLLQTAPWGQLKSEFGWRVIRLATQGCGAQILIRHILPGITFGYIPKGPLGENQQLLWPEIDTICRKYKCAFVKVEPDGWMSVSPWNIDNETMKRLNLVSGQHNIQPQSTLVVDIYSEESQILARMKQKTRYNINLALKKNVIVKSYNDLTTFYNLMEVTSQRDRFGIHSLAYYQRAYDLFRPRDMCQLLVAEYEGQAISALMVFSMGKRAWYFYGASSDLHRDKMPNYLLQWEAMRWAKSQGCTEYDLWGVPNADQQTLEANFSSRHDGLWGVYRFKRGFGGELKRSLGSLDRVYNPFLYRLYSFWLKYRKIEG